MAVMIPASKDGGAQKIFLTEDRVYSRTMFGEMKKVAEGIPVTVSYSDRTASGVFYKTKIVWEKDQTPDKKRRTLVFISTVPLNIGIARLKLA
jgi:hypothetical protein